jgi:hypothetical protein
MRNGKGTLSRRWLLAGAALVFAAVAALGFFRFRAFQLEVLLNDINSRIEKYSLEEIEFRQVFAGLTSPIKVYSHCKEILGMSQPKLVEEVRAPSSKSAALPAPKKDWRSGVLSVFGLPAN